VIGKEGVGMCVCGVGEEREGYGTYIYYRVSFTAFVRPGYMVTSHQCWVNAITKAKNVVVENMNISIFRTICLVENML